jgi:hypothetical protein
MAQSTIVNPFSLLRQLWLTRNQVNPQNGEWTLGSFNVSNVMGIKWRMVDIGKKLLFFEMFKLMKTTSLKIRAQGTL